MSDALYQERIVALAKAKTGAGKLAAPTKSVRRDNPLCGDRVLLEISPQRDTFASPEQNLQPGSVNTQRAATTVSGRLGEWIELGGIAQGGVNQQTVILGSTRETSADNRRVLVKVDEIR